MPEQERAMGTLTREGYGFEAWQTAGLNARTREGYVQAKGRLQPWNSKS